MYFINAVWYAFATLGFASIMAFAVMLLSVFNSEHIESEIGYRNYFIIMGSYALIALPLAATFNGGTGRDFMFFLGCECPGLIVVGNHLEARHKAERARRLKPRAPAQIAEPSAATIDRTPRPAYQPAAASLAGDFDIPPQE